MHPLHIVALILFLAMAAAGWASWGQLREKKWTPAVVPVLVTLLLGALSGLALTLWAAQEGYKRLTHEVTAATITTKRIDDNRFVTEFEWPDGNKDRYRLNGDALYVDARIVKWDPRLNLLGLTTAYQLDRVGGRYNSLAKEKSRARTVFALTPERTLDIFRIAERLGDRAPFVDAQYGSATFVPVRAGERYELRVSTSGLLLRPAE